MEKTEKVKIKAFVVDNFKRVKHVECALEDSGLTLLGGANDSGKTSNLDAVALALGGNRFKPSETKNRKSKKDPYLKVSLSNGLIVERKGKNSTLKVTTEDGLSGGQAILDKVIGTIALDLPKFLHGNDKDRLSIFLEAVGNRDELNKIAEERKAAYEQRRDINRDAKTLESQIDGIFIPDGTPDKEVDVSALAAEVKAISQRNNELSSKQTDVATTPHEIKAAELRAADIESRVADLKREMENLQDVAKGEIKEAKRLQAEYDREKHILNQKPEDDTALVNEINSASDINKAVGEKARLSIKKDELSDLNLKSAQLTQTITDCHMKRQELFDGAALPIDGLDITEDGKLAYKGDQWDCMSSSDKRIVAAAIASAVKPECGFVLVDKLEELDDAKLEGFKTWLVEHDLQALGTIVGDRGGCALIIEDGVSK